MNQGYSGRVFIEDNDVVWFGENGKQIDRVPIGDIKVIGELTTESLADDWWYCFVLGPDNIAEVSAYAAGVHEAVKQIGQRLGSDISCGLANCTTFKSRVLWPPELKEQPMYNFEWVKPERANFLQILRQKLSFEERLNVTLTPQLVEFLKAK